MALRTADTDSARPDYAFGDNRCVDHTDYENPEMIAFQRELAYLVGMPKPTAFFVSQLHISEVEKLLAQLTVIIPTTRKDILNKTRTIGMLKAAIAMLKWKEAMRRQRESEEWIPPEASGAPSAVLHKPLRIYAEEVPRNSGA